MGNIFELVKVERVHLELENSEVLSTVGTLNIVEHCDALFLWAVCSHKIRQCSRMRMLNQGLVPGSVKSWSGNFCSAQLWNRITVGFWNLLSLRKWRLCGKIFKESENLFGGNLKICICNWYILALQTGDSEIYLWFMSVTNIGMFGFSKLLWGVVLEGLQLNWHFFELQKSEVLIKVGFMVPVEHCDIQSLNFGKYRFLVDGFKLPAVSRKMQSIGSRSLFKLLAASSAQAWSGHFCSDQLMRIFQIWRVLCYSLSHSLGLGCVFYFWFSLGGCSKSIFLESCSLRTVL